MTSYDPLARPLEYHEVYPTRCGTEVDSGHDLELMPQVPDVDSRTDAACVVRLSDVEPESVEFLWPGRIARGKLNIVEGDPKTGKSTLCSIWWPASQRVRRCPMVRCSQGRLVSFS